MRIKWYGTASLLIEGGKSRVLIDPYLRAFNKKLSPVPVEEATTAEAIFITHPHFDHFGDVSGFIAGNVKRVYVSQNGIDIAQRMGFYRECMTPLCADDEVAVGDITVRAYRARHIEFDRASLLGIVLNPNTYIHFRHAIALLKGMKNFKITDDIYALEISCGGKNILALGSAGFDSGVEYPAGANLLVFPYQGRVRMHKYAIPFLHTLKPQAVMLDHFDNAFPPFTHTVNTKKFVPTVNKRFDGMNAFVPVENKWYEI